MPDAPVPRVLRAAAAGDPDEVRRLVEAFATMARRDPMRPWVADALGRPAARAAARAIDPAAWHAVDRYHARLLAAAAALLERGAAVLEPSNLRTARDGYDWGAPVPRSNILAGLGRSPVHLRRLGLRADDRVAERWFASDDPERPGWSVAAGAEVPLSWLVARAPAAVLGAEHVARLGPARGVVCKLLDAARPLSWQVHLGVEEGYLILDMPEGSGLVLGPEDPGQVRASLTGSPSAADPATLGIQVLRPCPGDRFVTRDACPHALFGSDDAIGFLIEFKGTALGPRSDTVGTASQTWALADNLFGKVPRPGKVTPRRLREAFAAMDARGTWRPLRPEDYAHRGDDRPVPLSAGTTWWRIHAEAQFSALGIDLEPGRAAGLRRRGLHSALLVRRGAVRVLGAGGRVVIEHLGLEDGWDGDPGRSDDALVFASQGDLVIEALGDGPATVFDVVRPVPGIPLPRAVPAPGSRPPGDP